MKDISALVILSHLMDSNGNLEKESILRIDKALKLYDYFKYDYFITSGWDYREDTRLKIGDVMAQELINNRSIKKNHIIIDTNARDTVGDAFFIRRRILKFPIKKMTVITSDYHVKRTKIIFKKFFEPKIKIEIVGAETNKVNYDTLNKYEELSTKAFMKTFSSVNFLSDDEVFKRLIEKHPYYNGDIYKKLK